MKAALYFLLCFLALTSRAEASDFETRITQFFKSFHQCLPDKARIRVGILGFHHDEQGLSIDEQTTIRLNVEELVDRQEKIELAPSNDLGTIIETAQSPGNFLDGNIRKLIKNATNVDGLIYFKLIKRRSNHVQFRLSGLSRQARCKKVSKRLFFEFQIGIDSFSIDQVLKIKSQELLESGASEIAILPFQSQGNLYNQCNNELQGRMGRALQKAKDSFNGVLKDAKLSIKYIRNLQKADYNKKTVAVDGKFGCDQNDNKWISIRFTHGKHNRQAIAPLVKTYVEGLKCGCRMKTFFEQIRANAKSCPSYFRMKAAEKIFYLGDNLDITLSSRKKTRLYCWYLADDKTGYILVPNREAPGLEILSSRSKKQYPIDFGWPSYTFNEEGKDMFGCFVRQKKLPSRIHQLWMKKWGPDGGRGEQGELVESEVFELLKMMRRQPGTSECYAPITVKKLQ